MADSEFGQGAFKERGKILLRGNEPVGKFGAVIRLDALYGIGKLLDAMEDKMGGGIGTVLLKGLQIAEAAVFVQEGVLVIAAICGCLAHQAALGNELDIDLHPLTGIGPLLIGLGNILGVRQFDRHLAALPQAAVQIGNGAGIDPLPQLDPEHHKPRVWVPAAYIPDQLLLRLGMLVGVAVRTAGAILQGQERTVAASAPAVDILSVCVITNCRLRRTVLLRTAN